MSTTEPQPAAALPPGSPFDPSFIGRGLRFPIAIDSRGGIALASGPEVIECALRVVLSTAPGERVMRPNFGCKIWDLLFEPINANTIGLMEEAVREAVAQWEPRVTLVDVSIIPDRDESALVRIAVTYEIRTTNDRRNLVYPFYVIPREPEEL
jgi:phage baseplate assembly protein W